MSYLRILVVLIAASAWETSTCMGGAFESSPDGSGGFSIIAGPGDVWSGAAVGFTPVDNWDVSSVTLWLSGYNGANGQQLSVGLYNDASAFNGTHAPAGMIASSVSPAPNDGSLAAFTFNLAQTLQLQADKTYWLFVYGELNDTDYPVGNSLTWAGGGTPSGDAVYVGTLASFDTSFASSSVMAAFSINADIISTPEPGTCAIISLFLAGAGVRALRRKLAR